MICNVDFLIAGLVILLLVLWYFLGQKRAEDLNNQVFFFLCRCWKLRFTYRTFQQLLDHFCKGTLWNSSSVRNNSILFIPGSASLCFYLLYSDIIQE